MLAHIVNGYSLSPNVSGRSLAHTLALALVWLTIASSGIVFSEPCPTDVLSLALIVGLPLIGLAYHSPQLALLLLMIGGGGAAGLLAASFAEDSAGAITHTLVTLYLGVGAFTFASFIAYKPVAHMKLIFSGWTVAAVIAAAAGIVGYFGLIPGSELFTKFERASGTFKDPNVFGPFLVPALLYALHNALERPLRKAAGPLLLAGFFSLAIFLSFSRGAWMNLIVALGIYSTLAFATAESHGRRQKIVFLAVLGAAVIAATVITALQFEKVEALVAQRASVAQTYDQGPEGRFGGQDKAFGLILENPLGIGAGSFALNYHHEEPHNVYLSMPLNAGWMGAGIYFAMVAFTILLGVSQVFKRSPWQPIVLIALSAFVANAAEGLIIDTDHWRHFYLLLAIVWGAAAADRNAATTSKYDGLHAKVAA